MDNAFKVCRAPWFHLHLPFWPCSCTQLVADVNDVQLHWVRHECFLTTSTTTARKCSLTLVLSFWPKMKRLFIILKKKFVPLYVCQSDGPSFCKLDCLWSSFFALFSNNATVIVHWRVCPRLELRVFNGHSWTLSLYFRLSIQLTVSKCSI